MEVSKDFNTGKQEDLKGQTLKSLEIKKTLEVT